MTNVAFVAPFAAAATLRFVNAIAAIRGVRCALITQEPLERLPADLRERLAGHWQVKDGMDPAQLVDATRGLARKLGSVDRLFGILEQAQVPIAEARQHLGLPGIDVETARNFRDKARMKTVLREAGVPCARHRLVGDVAAALDFARETGFPLVVKPPAGAGAKGTYRVEDEASLREAIAITRPRATQPVLLEEFITGREYSFDSIVVDGRMLWHSFSHYYPTPLEVLENPWIQWCVVLPRSIEDPTYARVREVAAAALGALGLRSGMSHMEWFLRHDGSVAISEVGARPPGAQFTSLLSYAHDLDFYVAWGKLMATGHFDPPPRRWAVGALYLRGQGAGRVHEVTGLAEAQAEIGPIVVEASLPKEGQSPAGTYEGDGYVIVRHEDTDVVKRALTRLTELVRVELS